MLLKKPAGSGSRSCDPFPAGFFMDIPRISTACHRLQFRVRGRVVLEWIFLSACDIIILANEIAQVISEQVLTAAEAE